MQATNRSLSWWQWGLVGGMSLAVVTVYKEVVALIGIATGRLDIGDERWILFLLLPVMTFVMGVFCGVIGWVLHRVLGRFGGLGDSVTGIIVLSFYFALCASVFGPQPVRVKFILALLVVLLPLTIPIGGYFGYSWGRDERRRTELEAARRQRTNHE